MFIWRENVFWNLNKDITISTGWTATFKKVKASNQKQDMPFPIVILTCALWFSVRYYSLQYSWGIYGGAFVEGIFSLTYISNWLLLVHIFKKLFLLSIYVFVY